MSQYFNFGVCGSGGVGKTCITIRITQGSYIGDFYDPTIDDSYEIKRNVDNKSVRLTINDTAGQDGYHCLLDITLRKVFGYVLVFDATSKKSLEDLNIFVKKIRNIRELNTPTIIENENITMEQQQQQYNQENNKRKVDFPCVIVASKSDLPNVISESEVRKYMNEVLLLSKEVPLIYVSAKENHNINLLLETIVREMRKFTNEKEEQEEEKKKRDKVMKKKKRTTSSSGNSKRITKEKSSSSGGMFASVLGSSGVEDDLDGLTY
ncbi:hypothetical protein ABK040_014303 [Willaertia magna]